MQTKHFGTKEEKSLSLTGSWSDEWLDEWLGCHESRSGISQGLVQAFSVPDSLSSIWNFIISPWTPTNTQLASHVGYIVFDTSLTLQCQLFLLQSKRKNRDLFNLWVTGSSLDIFFILQTSNGSIRYFIEKLCFIFPHFHRPQHQLSIKGEKIKKGGAGNPALQFLVKISQLLSERKWEEVVSVDTEVMTEELATQISGFLSHLLEPPTIGSLLKQWWDWRGIIVPCLLCRAAQSSPSC